MEIIWFLLFFIVIFILTSPKKQVKSIPCTKGHKWEYVNEYAENEYMQCSVCKRLPGQMDDGSQI